MTQTGEPSPGSPPPGEPDPARISIQDVARQQLRTLPLIGVIFFSVSGGPYGLEEAVSSSGPGMALLLLLVVPVIFALPCALMSAELGSAIPVEGGYYYWVKLALGRFAAFLVGAWQFLNSFLDTALYPVVFADYLAQWVPGLARGEHAVWVVGSGVLSFDAHWLVAVAFMVPLAWLNARGSRLVGDTSTALMVVVLAPFVVLGVLGLARLVTGGGVDPLTPFTLDGQSPTAAFGAGLAVVIWNYIGWDAPSTVLGEVVRPQRTYTKALAWALPLIMASYVITLVAAVGSGLNSGQPDAWADGDFASVGRLLGGAPLMVAVTVGAVVAQVGLFSSLLMSGSRVPRVLAADRYLPAWVARDHPRYRTPVAAITLSCVVFALFSALDFDTLIDADIMTNLAAIALEFAALVVLRGRFPGMRRPFRIPGGRPVLALVVAGPLITTVWLVVSTLTDEPAAFWIGVGILAFGAASYPVAQRWLKRDHPDAPIDVSAVDLGDGRPTPATLLVG